MSGLFDVFKSAAPGDNEVAYVAGGRNCGISFEVR